MHIIPGKHYYLDLPLGGKRELPEIKAHPAHKIILGPGRSQGRVMRLFIFKKSAIFQEFVILTHDSVRFLAQITINNFIFMKQDELDVIRRALLSEKVRIEEALQGVSHADERDHVPGEHEPTFPDYGDDNATELEDNSPNEVADFERNVSVTGDLGGELGRIQKALTRLEEGKYGTCLRCNKEIPLARLKVYPAALHCLPCGQHVGE